MFALLDIVYNAPAFLHSLKYFFIALMVINKRKLYNMELRVSSHITIVLNNLYKIILFDCQATSTATHAVQSAAAGRKDTMPNTLPSKIPRFEKLVTSCSISDDSLTKHLTALWEREDAAVPVTSTATLPASRVGSKRKAASVSSYLSDGKPDDVSVPSADNSNQPNTTTILSQLLSSFTGITSSPASVSVLGSIAADSQQLSMQKNILLMQKERQSVATANRSAPVTPSSLPLRLSAGESISATNNVFRLPTYEQVIGNKATLSSPLMKADTATNDVFLPSPQIVSSSSFGSVVSSFQTDAISASAGAVANSFLLLSQSTTDSAAIASHMQLDDTELLRQLEQILSEPGLSLSDIDNVLGGCLSVPQSLPQTLSAVDQRAISLIQSQLMSMETSQSLSTVANNVGAQWRNGTLCQLLSGKSPLTSDTLLSTEKSRIRSHPSAAAVNNQALLATASDVKSSHIGSGQY